MLKKMYILSTLVLCTLHAAPSNTLDLQETTNPGGNTETENFELNCYQHIQECEDKIALYSKEDASAFKDMIIDILQKEISFTKSYIEYSKTLKLEDLPPSAQTEMYIIFANACNGFDISLPAILTLFSLNQDIDPTYKSEALNYCRFFLKQSSSPESPYYKDIVHILSKYDEIEDKSQISSS